MLYLAFMRNKFKSNFAYRTDLYLRIAFQIIVLFIQIPLWRAVLGQENNEFHSMVVYVIVSTMISGITSNGVIEKVNQKIRTGEIAMDMIKPINFISFILCDSIGDNLFRLIFEVFPVFLFGLIFFGMSVPGISISVFFIVSVLLAFLLNFFLGLTLGLVAFWYLSVWHLGRLLEDVIKLFGGSIIPLWYFPDVFQTISTYLPFQYIFYVPISIYLRKYSIGETWKMIGLQILWCMVGYGLLKFVWKKGNKKVVVQGG